MSTKLTIGMAHFNDFDGVFFTIQALRMCLNTQNVEFIVVDNAPGTEHGENVRRFLLNVPNARYVVEDNNVGTAAPRNRVFREATGDAVLCMDCHVLLTQEAIGKLLSWYDANPDTRDLLTGPMWYDGLSTWSTHFNLKWNAAMWGVWGLAWRCNCGKLFTVMKSGGNQAIAHDLLDVTTTFDKCPSCSSIFPLTGHSGHEKVFYAAGYRPACISSDEDPFEIPAQGLGLFTCKRDAWLGFNENFRNFGGEEGYIHTKYRQAGHKCLNLPFLGWTHRFKRIGGPPYPAPTYSRVRNYVIGHQELSLPILPVHDHFCLPHKDNAGNIKPPYMLEAEWQHLVKDPKKHINKPSCIDCSTAALEMPSKDLTIEQIYAQTIARPRDMEQHFPRFRELASQCSRVTAITKRKELDAVLLAARPKTLRVFTAEPHAMHKRLKDLAIDTDYTSMTCELGIRSTLDETDLLILHTIHQADWLYAELVQYAPKVSRYIVVCSTAAFGETGEPDGPGMFEALRKYLREHPEWSAVEHSTKQYGYTILSKNPDDKQKLPILPAMAWNYGIALAKHKLKGSKTAKKETVESRLDKCAMCPMRTANRCAACGCYLDVGPKDSDGKTLWPESYCPIGAWSEEAVIE